MYDAIYFHQQDVTQSMPQQGVLSDWPDGEFPYPHKHYIHPAVHYPSPFPDPEFKNSWEYWRRAAVMGAGSDLMSHLKTFSMVDIWTSKALIYDRRPTLVKFKYALSRTMDWVDIIATNIVTKVRDLHLNQPKESLYLSGAKQHTLSGGPAWRGQDLLLTRKKSSNDEMGRVQLDVDLTYYMGGARSTVDQIDIVFFGKSQDLKAQRTWIHNWTGVAKLDRQRSDFILSLSGKIERICLTNTESCQNLSLNIFWIATHNRKFKQLLDSRPGDVASRKMGKSYRRCCHHGFVFDWTFEPPPLFKRKYIAPFAFISFKYHEFSSCRADYSHIRGTWIEAMQLCTKFNGSLPILRSREELDHLLSLFKLPFQTPPPMPVMFIGLIKTKVKRLELSGSEEKKNKHC